MSQQCRYCVHARENGTRYTCLCLLRKETVSLYKSCSLFSDDWRDKYVNSNREDNRSSR